MDRSFVSLGGGVQSSCLCLMGNHGEITPRPEAAIFADTGAETDETYRWIEWLEGKLDFPVIHTRRERADLLTDVTDALDSGEVLNIPLHSLSPEGKKQMLPRRCTINFKVEPLVRRFRSLLGLAKGQRTKGKIAELWIGISYDEVSRISEPRAKFYGNRYPLIEKRMQRVDCLRWMKDKGYPRPPRSACWFCAFRTDQDWRDMRDKSPDAWEKAKALDARLRERHDPRGEKFLNRRSEPLSEVDLSTDVERGQTLLWTDECSGVCGV